MNILLAVAGSPYTERMLAYLSSHQTPLRLVITTRC